MRDKIRAALELHTPLGERDDTYTEDLDAATDEIMRAIEPAATEPEPAAVNEMLSEPDARIWAREFLRTIEADGAMDIPARIDEGLMLGWFANAFETQKAADRREIELSPAEQANLLVTYEAVESWGIPGLVMRELFGSGAVYLINRLVLHPMGLALGAVVELHDGEDHPDDAVRVGEMFHGAATKMFIVHSSEEIEFGPDLEALGLARLKDDVLTTVRRRVEEALVVLIREEKTRAGDRGNVDAADATWPPATGGTIEAVIPYKDTGQVDDECGECGVPVTSTGPDDPDVVYEGDRIYHGECYAAKKDRERS